MTTIAMLTTINSLCKLRSTEGKSEVSKSEFKRWCEKGSVLVNGEKMKWDEELDFPIFSFILHPKGNRITLV